MSELLQDIIDVHFNIFIYDEPQMMLHESEGEAWAVFAKVAY